MSEYDGAVRPQPDLFVQKDNAKDGWVKVPGMAALTHPGPDAEVAWSMVDMRLTEMNCGDACEL